MKKMKLLASLLVVTMALTGCTSEKKEAEKQEKEVQEQVDEILSILDEVKRNEEKLTEAAKAQVDQKLIQDAKFEYKDDGILGTLVIAEKVSKEEIEKLMKKYYDAIVTIDNESKVSIQAMQKEKVVANYEGK